MNKATDDLQGVPQSRSGAQGPDCPYCHGCSIAFVESTDYNRGTTSARFRYFRCMQCGLVFMSPLPADMRTFYAGGYDPIPSSLAELKAIAADETYRMAPILRYKTGGRLLEIGPWRGVFCCNAHDHGFAVSAIEMDQNCVSFLRNTLGIRAIQSDDPAEALSELNNQGESFDVIAMWHSMEHLPRPWAVVERCASLLAPGGLLLIAIPNIESYEYSVLKGRWRHLDTPRHLFFYPVGSLVNLCQENGLDLLELKTDGALNELLALDTWRKVAHSILPRWSFVEPVHKLLYHYARLRQKRMVNAGSGLIAVFQKK